MGLRVTGFGGEGVEENVVRSQRTRKASARTEDRGGFAMRGQGKGIEDLKDESPFKAKKYTVVKQWSFEDSKFKRVARPDIYKSSMVSCGLPGDKPVPVPLAPDPDRS